MEIMYNGKPIDVEEVPGEDTFDIFKPIEDIDLEETQKIEVNNNPSKDGDDHE